MQRCPLCTAILQAEATRCEACGKKLPKDKARRRGLGLLARKGHAVEEEIDDEEQGEPADLQPFDHSALFEARQQADADAAAAGSGRPPPVVESFDHSALFADMPGSSSPAVGPADPPDVAPPADVDSSSADSFDAGPGGFDTDQPFDSSNLFAGAGGQGEAAVDPSDDRPAFGRDDFASLSEAESSEVESFDPGALFADDRDGHGFEGESFDQVASPDDRTDRADLFEPFDPVGEAAGVVPGDNVPPPPPAESLAVPPPPVGEPFAPTAASPHPTPEPEPEPFTPLLVPTGPGALAPPVLAARDEPPDSDRGDDDLFAAFAEGFFDD